MINLKFKVPYKSITSLNEITLPNFTVLTGVNGSGKTHLLQGIAEKKIIITSLEEEARPIYFDYQEFQLKNDGGVDVKHIKDIKKAMFDNKGISSYIVGRSNNLIAALGSNHQKLEQLAKNLRKGLWALEETEVNNNSVFTLLIGYKKRVENFFLSLSEGYPLESGFYFEFLNSIKNSPCIVTQAKFNQIIEALRPVSYYNHSSLLQLNEIFLDYHNKSDKNRYNAFQNKEYGKNYHILSDEEFQKVYGDKPWNVINRILEGFEVNYRINSPEGLEENNTFVTKLEHIRNKICINYSDLSSGERTLMALVTCIYRYSLDDKNFPNILLLDEIDASLHPLMIDKLLNIIQDIFISKNIKVILVTHSPSTIALSPDESIFIVSNYGKNRIEKKSKEDALEELTNGFVSNTIENETQILNYRLVKTSRPTIFTEGPTDKIILKTAWEKLFPQQEMPFDIISPNSGAKFLRNYIAVDFPQQSGHRNGLALFDFDCEGYSQWNGIKNFASLTKDTFIKCSEDKKAYAMLLMVPDHLREYVFLSNGSLHAPEDLKLEIEHLFIKDNNNNANFTKLCPNYCEARGILNTGKKSSLPNYEKILSNFSQDDFNMFHPLLEKIVNLFKS